MTRANQSRVWYVIVLLFLGGCTWAVIWALQLRGQGLLLFGLVLLIPGRVMRFFWRDFYRARAQLRTGDYAGAADGFKAFLEQLRARPWIKRLLFTQWSLETWDAEAMTLNNLGVAEMCRGEPERATQWFEEAIRVDPKYGLPLTSLATLRSAAGDDIEAERLLAQANALGCRPWPKEALPAKGAELRAAWAAQKAESPA